MMCRWGDTVDVEVTIPADLSHTGKVRRAVKPIDRCLADRVREYDRQGLVMRGSCCGHGQRPSEIVFNERADDENSSDRT